MSRARFCSAPNCPTVIASDSFMCGPHWAQLPADLQAAVFALRQEREALSPWLDRADEGPRLRQARWENLSEEIAEEFAASDRIDERIEEGAAWVKAKRAELRRLSFNPSYTNGALALVIQTTATAGTVVRCETRGRPPNPNVTAIVAAVLAGDSVRSTAARYGCHRNTIYYALGQLKTGRLVLLDDYRQPIPIVGIDQMLVKRQLVKLEEREAAMKTQLQQRAERARQLAVQEKQRVQRRSLIATNRSPRGCVPFRRQALVVAMGVNHDDLRDPAQRQRLLRENGICTDCEKRPSAEGRHRCQGCMEYRRALTSKKAAERMAAGFCTQCGGAKDGGVRRCQPCKDKRKLLRSANTAVRPKIYGNGTEEHAP